MPHLDKKKLPRQNTVLLNCLLSKQATERSQAEQVAESNVTATGELAAWGHDENTKQVHTRVGRAQLPHWEKKRTGKNPTKSNLKPNSGPKRKHLTETKVPVKLNTSVPLEDRLGALKLPNKSEKKHQGAVKHECPSKAGPGFKPKGEGAGMERALGEASKGSLGHAGGKV